ncbi:MAG: glycosyltransferase [bacterium]
MRTQLKVSVIIPVYNMEKTLGLTIKSILKSNYKNIEIVIVDDCSDDDSVKIAKSFSCRVVQLKKRIGAGPARNKGAEIADGKILLFIDADVFLLKNTIDEAIKSLTDHPEYSAVVGDYAESTVPKNFLSIYKNLFHNYYHQTSNKLTSTFFTACSAVRKDVFDKIGGFEDRKGAKVEDIELGYKMFKEKHLIFLNSNMQVVHCKKYTFLNLIKSDLFYRAIPWTKLICKSKMFNNDLNTRYESILSVILVYLLIFCLLFGVFLSWKSMALLFCVLVFLSFFLININIFKFFLKRTDIIFSIRSFFMLMIYYFYCGIGFLIGTSSYLIDKLKIKSEYT